MDNKQKFIPDISTLTKIVGVGLGVLLVVLEAIIAVQFVSIAPLPPVWKTITFVGLSVALDILCMVEMYAVKTFKIKVIIYSFEFLILFFVCVLTGSPYISGLCCVILSQLYLNVLYLKTKTAVFVASSVMYIVMCIMGSLINYHWILPAAEILNTVTGSVVGVIILAVHFVVANFLIGFYRNNLKLDKALKEADDSKKQLEEAYRQLSDSAVFQERNRIARDIHDNAGHSMTAVIMQTEAAKLIIDTNPEEAKNKIISANIQAKNALEQMRESVHLLAGRQSSCTMKEELEEILAQTMDGTDVKIRYDIADVTADVLRRRFIANSLKELLSNGMRHGGASAFYVELSQQDDVITLIVSDNGCGLPEDFKEGFGIKGIREKAAAFGGGIVFESESGDGCEIAVTVKQGDVEEE